MIEVDALRKAYRKSRGLDSFSLQVKEGEFVGLVGPNGAGKTTLIKILATILRADSGSVRVNGYDVSSGARDVRASLGYLPDFSGIYQDMRIKEFLEFFADAFRLPDSKRSVAVDRALERAGLIGRQDDYVEHLSLGWKQRLLLAKILLHGPKILLLDEPATGLDPLARITLREQLKQLHSEGVTILISSHILSDLEDICTRIVFIADGRNVPDPQPAEGVGASPISCELEFAGPAEVVSQVVSATAGARVLQHKPGFLRVELPGSSREASNFLQRLLSAGMLVTRFDARGPGLEERYRRAFKEHS